MTILENVAMDDTGSFLSNWSLEVVPTEDVIDPAIYRAREGTRIYIASVPGRPIRYVVDASVKLRMAKFEPIPHIAARGLKHRMELDDLLARLRGEADVNSVMLLGGDIDASMTGAFRSSRTMLATGLFARHGIRNVGFATYPEPHPLIEKSVLEKELAAKLQLAMEQGLESWLVTQLCFDSDTVVRHAERLRMKRIEAPIHVGIAGPTSWKGLAKFARICGVDASARSIMTQASHIGRLLLGFEPSEMVSRIAAAAHAELGLVQPHFFTFGGAEKTVDWLDMLATDTLKLLTE